jgi:acetyl-CoA acetyltransferase
VSDGGAAFVVSRSRTNDFGVRILGAGQAHRHQHISALGDMVATGAAEAMSRAIGQTSFKVRDARYLAIYDSFTITLCMLLEELGVAERGRAAACAREGRFNHDGSLPLNTHGGLLSYGHCGVGGALAHLVETHLQMTGRAGTRQVKDASVALLHGDGGVLSSHVSLILEQVQ